MAHFAKIGLHSKVIAVHSVNNSDILNGDGVEDEEVGRQFLENLHGWPYGYKHPIIHVVESIILLLKMGHRVSLLIKVKL